MTPADANPALSVEQMKAAQQASSAIVRRTPVFTSASLAEQCGGTILLKAENLQRTGSFKLRGALNKLRGVATEGVVAGSAGNHAQSLAYAARAHGVRCEVFMPTGAALSKVAAARAYGAHVHQQGTSVDECVALARSFSAESGLTFVHPFDDLEVIAGQAGVGLELVADVPDLAKVVVPVGGGGLAAGTAMAVKQLRPDVEIVGVQAAVCAPYPESLRAGAPVTAVPGKTIADGIAIKRPGDLTLGLIERWLDAVVTVDEAAIASAMLFLMGRSKLLVEGAGAAAVAALLWSVAPASSGATVAILSGGNVDPELVANLVVREETRTGRRQRLFTRVSDRPGGLADFLAAVALCDANVIAVEHVRDGVPLAVRQTGVMLTVEIRGAEHFAQLTQCLTERGYDVHSSRDSGPPG